MLAVLRTSEILAIFAAAGIPVTLALRPCLRGGRTAQALLAPPVGLAVVAIYGFMLLGFGRPIVDGVVPFWAALGVAWLIILVRYGRKAASHLASALRSPSLLPWGGIAIGFLIVTGFFLLPFLKSPDLVFWHYSGSDGYFYMSVAERLGGHSRWDLPQIGPYDGAEGFLTQDLRLFDSPQGHADKPGTFALLANLSSLLGLLPHEVFSPLMAAAAGTLFLSLTRFGLAFGVSRWIAPLFGVAGSLAMVVWYFGYNTFLGNMLTLPLVAAVLGLVDVRLSLASGCYGGLLLGAIMVMFPDAPLPIAAVGAPSLALVLVRAVRQKRALRLLGGIGTWLATMAVVMLPMFGYLLRSANVFVFLDLLPLPGLNSRTPQPGTLRLGHPIEHSDWLWPALNLNILPPVSITGTERLFLALLIALYLASLVLALRQRQGRLFLLGVAYGLLLLAGTLGGIVSDDYNLFRAVALFWLIPLALLFHSLSIAVSGVRQGRGTATRLGHAFLGLALMVLLARFARNDFRQFAGAWIDHLPDAQYTQADIDDRRAVTAVVGNRTITAGTEVPTFTGFANVLMLFSSLHLGTPNYFYNRLFFLPDDPPKDVPYTADLVLRTLKYTDVYNVPPDRPRLYRSTDYEVLQNDLIPFFDNNTLTQSTGFPTAFMKARNLTLTREFSKATDIKFFSRQERDVRVGFQFSSGASPKQLTFAVDGGGALTIPVPTDARVELPRFVVSQGLHRLTLAGPDAPAQLVAMKMD